MFKNSVLAVICGAAVLVAVSACGGDDDDGGSSAGATCEDMCNKTASLNCPGQADCASSCAGLEALREQCGTELDAAMQCAASADASEFSCDSSGFAVTPACASHQSALMACALGGMFGGGGAAGAGG